MLCMKILSSHFQVEFSRNRLLKFFGAACVKGKINLLTEKKENSVNEKIKLN